MNNLIDSSSTYSKIDNVCRSSFTDSNGDGCTKYVDNGWCNSTPEFFLSQAGRSSNGWVTGLNCIECGCDGTPTSLYDVPVVVPTAAPTVAPTIECGIDDPDSQYCFTVPDSHAYYYDNYDGGHDYYGEWMDDIDAGDTVKFSKMCTDQWFLAGTSYQEYGEYSGQKYDCEWFFDNGICTTSGIDWLIATSVQTDNGLITGLNCPQCGCTLGNNDAITLIERSAGERSTGGDAVHRPSAFAKALKKKKAVKKHSENNSMN